MFVTPNAIGYGASKHALAGFFNTLRIELDGSGVSITSLYPEWVDTGISSRALRSDGKFSGKINSHERGAMSPDAFATIVLRAAARRKRDIISPKLKFGLLLAPFFPGLVDRISTKSFVDIEHSK